MKKLPLAAVLLMLATLVSSSCNLGGTSQMDSYQIDADTQGVMEFVNNIYNTVVVSNDPNVYKAEYEAGFIQGKLQKAMLPAARDNGWDGAYLMNPSHSYPKQIPPSGDEMSLARNTLNANWDYTLEYLRRQGTSDIGRKLRRLMYRLVGIYHGAVKDSPQALEFTESWFPAFSDNELSLGYETPSVTFMDVYFINAIADIFDVLPGDALSQQAEKPTKCTAFVKRTPGGDIVVTHNTWDAYLNQSQAVTLWVNGDFMTMNTFAPGLLSSFTDFGYNNKGLIFNETTDAATYSRPQIESLWMLWRSTLAEQFAASIPEFFHYATLELSGTYQNSYMVVDTKTGQTGLIDMSYQSAVLFTTDGNGGVEVTTKPDGLNKAYDQELVRPDYLLGINYPASQQIINDLQPIDTRPARKRQLMQRIGSVSDIETAKALITYTDPNNPLSIYGRWDLGYGETPRPKTVPDGSIDAKAVSTSMIGYVFDLKGVLDTASPVKIFWMKFGTPYVNGRPFIWSQSEWKSQKLRFVPDVVDGQWTLLNGYIR